MQFARYLDKQPDPTQLTQVVMAPRDPDPNTHEKFRKLGAIKFIGHAILLDVDDWLVEIENVFEVLVSTGRQKVSLAAYMFEGVTDTWWKNIQVPYKTMEDATTWNAFKDAFSKKLILAPNRVWTINPRRDVNCRFHPPIYRILHISLNVNWHRKEEGQKVC